MSLTRALALNTGVQLAGKIVSTGLGVVIIGIMTRYLGQEGFGIYSTANAFLQVFALLMDLGLNVTLIALLGEHAHDKAYEKRCVSALFTLRIVMAVFVIGLLAPIAAWFTPGYSPLLKGTIFLLTASFFFPALNQVVTGVQQRHLKMQTSAIGEVLGRIVLLIGLLIATRLHWELLPIVCFVSAGSFANFLLCYLHTKRYSALTWNWDPTFWKSALQRSWPVGVSIAFNLIYFKADTLILSWVRSTAEVGIYSAAYRVLEILITIPFMYAGLLLPILSRFWAHKEKKQFAELLGRSVDITLLLIMPMMMGVWILGTPLMTFVAGKDFAASGEIIRILILAVGIIYLNVVFSHAVVALDAQRKMLGVYIATALITLAGYLFFIPAYGMIAAAWLTVFSEICVGLGSMMVTRRYSSLGLRGKTGLAALGASVVMAICIWPLRTLWVPIPIVGGAIAYLGSVWLFGGISKTMIQNILTLKQPPAEPPLG